jgi:hypothetical protein
MSLQFASNLQQSYAQLLEDVGTSVLNILRDFAKTKRVAMVAGKSSRSMMKDFTGDDLSLINRVVVDMGNPLARTTAGRINLAENLLQNKLIDNPDQYIQVLSTGRLEPMIEGKQAELLNIKAENEELSEMREVPVVITDKHEIHILEHKTVLASPEARRNPQLIAIVTKHIQDHFYILRTADPAILQLLGSKPMAPTAPGPNGPGMQAVNPLAQQAEQVNQPGLPSPPTGADPATSAIINQMKQGQTGIPAA